MEEAGIAFLACLLGNSLDGPGFEFGRGKIFFSYRPDRFWSPPSILFSRRRGSFPGVKGPRREADILFHLALRLRMGRAIPLFLYKHTWHGHGQLCLNLHV